MQELITGWSGHAILPMTNSHFIVLGGFTNEIKNTLRTCEEYYNSSWDSQSIPPMNTPRAFLAATKFKAMDIFVFCGSKNGYNSGALSSI